MRLLSFTIGGPSNPCLPRSPPTNRPTKRHDTTRRDTTRGSLCVWAAGTGPRQLTKDLIASIPEQAASKPGSRGRLLVDPYMRVMVGGWVAWP